MPTPLEELADEVRLAAADRLKLIGSTADAATQAFHLGALHALGEVSYYLSHCPDDLPEAAAAVLEERVRSAAAEARMAQDAGAKRRFEGQVEVYSWAATRLRNVPAHPPSQGKLVGGPAGAAAAALLQRNAWFRNRPVLPEPPPDDGGEPSSPAPRPAHPDV